MAAIEKLNNRIAITIDIDWAPDFAIQYMALKLLECKVRATWFVTHSSTAVDNLKAHPGLFEIGIHPNFLPSSTHGSSPEEVLDHCMGLVPDAISMRAHALMQSSPLLQLVATRTPIKIDNSLFLPETPNLQPVKYFLGEGRYIMRIPYYWEDDTELGKEKPCWDIERLLSLGEGLKVFNFHPIHVFLNSDTVNLYNQSKKQIPNLSSAKIGQLSPFINRGEGVGTIFESLITVLAKTGSAKLIRELVQC